MSNYAPEHVDQKIEFLRHVLPEETNIRGMLRAYAATLRQQSERGDGAVSDEAVGKLRSWIVSKTGMRIHPDELRAAIEAVAPLLRAPVEQDGRVDAALDAQLLIANNDAALAQNAQGDAAGEVFGPKAVSTMVALDKPLPPGTKLYTHAERARVPTDWVLVPREPGAEMMTAGRTSAWPSCSADVVYRIYAAMLAAAPSQPEDAA